MKIFLFLSLFPIAIIAQKFQINDPYPTSVVTFEVYFQVDKYYPIFGSSEKPYSNELIFKLTDRDGKYIGYIHFFDKYSPPQFDARSKILRLFYPVSYYDYIKLRLDNDESFVAYREYKDGHKWGELLFNKYP